LIELASAGDHNAFAVLTSPYREPLVQFAARKLGRHRHLAEDVVQEALLNAYRAMLAGGRPENIRAWLFTIVRNVAINAHRAQRPTYPLGDHELGDMADTLSVAERGEWIDWLMGAISQLPDRQRSVLVGYAFEGRSYLELADRHHTSVSAVKTLMYRARRGLGAVPWTGGFGLPLSSLAGRVLSALDRWATTTKALLGPVSQVLGTAALASGVLIAIPGSTPGPALAHPTNKRPTSLVAGAVDISSAASLALDRSVGRQVVACLGSHTHTQHYTWAALQYAMNHLDEFEREYSACQQQLNRALYRVHR
jgi:RNA polymerase sigma factor (sigma-70 family)